MTIKKKKLTVWWSNEPLCLHFEGECLELPAKFDTVILAVKRNDEPPLVCGRFWGRPISDKKFAVGFMERPFGVWNLWLKLEGEHSVFFENFRDCDFDGQMAVCLYAVSFDGSQYFVHADNLCGEARVVFSRWEKTDLEQPLAFATSYFQRYGWTPYSLINNGSLMLEEGDFHE